MGVHCLTDKHSCVLCDDNANESMEHRSLFACPFSQGFWWRLDIDWNPDVHFLDMLISTNQFHVNNPREVLILGCWSIWNHMNYIIFQNGDRLLNVAMLFSY
ncbi:hypothetical protein BRADI_5g00746v3 [Brachypodium distachyon]|uniref:Reverse transcriptase zinc-binding domain-containing protein n=1 Tax=Brachypodium distachyon TaxID=15368 RepID=A0A2K2CEP0_BRADI|nr:hypothetical protein BRADI_5g00746v3 [Brachypodium distachyon]